MKDEETATMQYLQHFKLVPREENKIREKDINNGNFCSLTSNTNTREK
jgi:hypothetical protein